MKAYRLAGKPLALIGGLPMVVQVLRRGREAGIGPVLVAAADPEIVDAVQADGGLAVLTDPDLCSGSDRVHAGLAQFDPARAYDVVINLQGDVPAIQPDTLAAVLRPLMLDDYDIGTLVAPIVTDEEADRSSIVKAVCDFADGQDVASTLYFSRAAVPWGEGPLWHHVGVYAYRRATLSRFVTLPQSPLERRESLEQLRALEAGMRIGAVRINHAPLGVDTPEDLERVRRDWQD